ncbi:hypothetical protein E3O45_08025 [Cryobacterium sp. TMS1-20-1]|uniref:hypothetical protein n=1 Tax=Cryobacterium sp. TMS1-20-1 TaxID=1259223 RepID=UPI00106B84DF|nr:hypothetical protein [Cryobacterium sp. TMS1-20-1]TFC76700.1 hypothetical protein E3O45_08025 [Cryobacterium sp. TMS1-20-1]
MTQHPRRRRIIAYSAIGLFLLIDAVLITSALTSTSVDAAVDASSEPAATASAFPVPSATPTASPTVAPAVMPLPAARLLSAVSATAAWRASTGNCSAPAAPELSTDSGSSWTATDATGRSGATALQSIAAQSESVAEFIGLDEDCAPQFIKTFVAGDNYSSYPDELDDAWYVDPADRAAVHGPDGLASAPCDAVVALAASPADADSAAVLCADARIFATTDAAASWSAPLTVPGVLTLTATDLGYIALAAGEPAASSTDAASVACLGLSVVDVSVIDPAADPATDPATETAALSASTTGCYATDEAPAELAANIAVASADDTLWLWIGDLTLRSTDAGQSWL